ncbi:MAG: nicotinate-nicotinamide nucleotide adenylyltransferase [Candidatus Poribacteria bacterium]|nr:nicotinate-nicotinamide nucleotide adenylyltransferase [Candidatus Poribacteria bacterium]
MNHEVLDKFRAYPEYEKYSQLINELDPNAPPQVVIVHRTPDPICGSGKKLGIFSGSFNPLTVAHIKMVEEARERFQLDELLLLLAKANVDKDLFGWPLAGRILSLKRYAEDQNNISIGISSHGRYIDKVEALKTIYPVDTEFHFIVGYDTLVRIFDPKYYTDIQTELQHLFLECRFIVANRDQVDIETIKEFLSQPAHQQYRSSVTPLRLPDFYAEVSSTEVRQRIAQGDTISHLVPPVIAEFFE